MSGFNAAVSYNIQNAVAGTSPDFEVDYEKAFISRGDLPNATGRTISICYGQYRVFHLEG